MKKPHRMMRRLEEAEALDGYAKAVAKVVQRAVRPRMIRNVLSGAKMGHPLHPPLTDVPIGAWSMSALLDLAGGRESEPAADLLVKAGLVTALPTALTGLNDWSDTLGADRRVGLVHAWANGAALALYAASAVARHRGNRGSGKALGFAGLGMMAIGGYLGGHLSFANGVNVNRTAWDQEPTEWTPVLADGDLADGEHRTADAAGVEVLLYRKGATIYAMSATCTHLGGPLGEGSVENDCVTCPWHGSVFRFADGGIERGPASSPQPHFETRVQNGRIEVRLAPPNPSDEEDEAGIHQGDRTLTRTSAS